MACYEIRHLQAFLRLLFLYLKNLSKGMNHSKYFLIPSSRSLALFIVSISLQKANLAYFRPIEACSSQ